MTNSTIKPTVGRVVWFHPSKNSAEPGFSRHAEGEPYAAMIAHVNGERLVNLTVFDANGAAHPRTSVELVQDGCSIPGSGYYAEWMPYQNGQAAKTEVAEKGADSAPTYREPTLRDDLERALVQGASVELVRAPHRAAEIARGIKRVLNSLHPQSGAPERDHDSTVLYPAIRRAMEELQSLRPGFNGAVDRAYNLLHDAFWSETPAPASEPAKRPLGAAGD